MRLLLGIHNSSQSDQLITSSQKRHFLAVILIALTLLVSLPSSSAAQGLQGIPDEARFKAQRIRYKGDKMLASGDVRVEHRGALLQANEIEYDEGQKTIKAEGNVRLTQEGETLYAESMIYHTDAARAILWNAHGATSRLEMGDKKMTGKIFFWGRKIVRERDFLKIEKAIFTTCDVPKPEYHYHITANEAIIYPDDKLIARQVGVHLHNKLLLNRPLVVLSLRKEDNKQNLIPQAGYNQMDGYYIRESIPVRPRPNENGRLNVDWYQKTGIGGGLDYAYRLGGNGWGTLHWYQLSPNYEGLMPNEIQSAANAGKIGKQELSNYMQYNFPGNFYAGLGYSSYRYAYPQTGSISWNNNNVYLGKTTNRYSALFNQAVTSYNNLNYVSRNLEYNYKINRETRFHVGGLFSTYEGSNFPPRTLWEYYTDVFTEGEFLDTMLSYKHTTGNSAYYFDKLPEFALNSKKASIMDVPFNVAFSAGNYHEEPTHVQMGRTNLQIATRNLSWPVGEGGRFDFGCGFRQLNYENKGAKYVLSAGSGYYQDMGILGARVNYFYQRPEGYTPFLNDFVGRYNIVTGGIDLFNQDRFKLCFFSGMDLDNSTWHNVIGRVYVMPWKNTNLDFGTSYNLQRGEMDNVNSSIRLDIGGGFSVAHWSFYDILQQKLVYQDFCIAKEDHDFLSRVVYRSEQKEFWLQFALKSFPHETVPIGSDVEKIIMPNKFR
jgi:hypothetical protein